MCENSSNASRLYSCLGSLRVAAQVNALAQVVQRGQVFAPVLIQMLQQHGVFKLDAWWFRQPDPPLAW